MIVGSLFSGIGGLDLGAELAGWDSPAWFVESDPWARAVLRRHWPDVEVFTDVRWAPWSTMGPVDALVGGFPCQDVSVATEGRRGLTDDSRSGLWRYFARAIGVLRPRLVLVENVSGLITLGLDRVLGDLAGLGLDAEWATVCAADIGAPHRRERVFILAHADPDRGRREKLGIAQPAGLDGAPGREPHRLGAVRQLDDAPTPADPASLGRGPRDGLHGRGPALDGRTESLDGGTFGAYAPAVERWERIVGRPAPAPVDARHRLSPRFVEWMMGLPDNWTDGLTRTAALRCLGNSVVPQQAAAALDALSSRAAA